MQTKEAVKGFQTLVFGGGLSKTAFFKNEIKPAAEAVFKQKTSNASIDFVFPEKAAVMFAAASTVNPEALKVNANDLCKRNEREARIGSGAPAASSGVA